MLSFNLIEYKMAAKISVILCCLLAICKGQQLKDVVTSHVKDAVRNTKIQLGYGVSVKGQSGYQATEAGQNITFVLSGVDLGFGDPFVKLSYTSKNTYGFQNFGNTESGQKVNNPDWTQAFWFIYNKGTGQKWSFSVFDHSTEDSLIGEGVLDLDSFVDKGDNATATIVLDASNTTAEFPNAQLIVKRTTPLKFKLAASNIPRSDEFNGRSDPYVKVYFRSGEHGSDTKFYTTSTIDNVDNARWDDVVEFLNYRPKTNQYLHFKLRDSDSVTKDDHLGEVIVSADSIYYDKEEQTLFLENSGQHSSLTIVRI